MARVRLRVPRPAPSSRIAGDGQGPLAPHSRIAGDVQGPVTPLSRIAGEGRESLAPLSRIAGEGRESLAPLSRIAGEGQGVGVVPDPPTTAPHHARVVADVLAARHFRHLSPDLVARVAAVEAPKAPRHADAVDRVKRRLHQVANAYAPALHAPRDAIDALHAAAGDDDALRTLAVSLMHGHASTAERLRHLDLVAPALRRAVTPEGTTPPRRVIDLACGLNPLLLPWLGLPRDSVYDAYDVDARLVGIVGAFLAAWGQAGSATVRDVAGDPVRDPADVAIILKAMPCLDQVRPGNARIVLEALDVRRAVVTWPVQSLGGASKGMRATYRRAYDALVAGLPYAVTEVAIPGELAYVLERRAPAATD